VPMTTRAQRAESLVESWIDDLLATPGYAKA